ncbi:MAG: 4Fe-4S dicluster domain-containing protein [Lachnospiraceae bacterium]|nr:4Fe-4S dicluster domain-containing protein [Lachnospiraceae bacterium]
MRTSKLPVLFEKNEECCGCGLCAALCLKEAIKIILDEEGFYYPVIDSTKCIGCERCLSVCPQK